MAIFFKKPPTIFWVQMPVITLIAGCTYPSFSKNSLERPKSANLRAIFVGGMAPA
jgi:hypothetical protein